MASVAAHYLHPDYLQPLPCTVSLYVYHTSYYHKYCNNYYNTKSHSELLYIK